VGNRTLSAMRRVLNPNGKCVMAGAPKELWGVVTRLFKAFACSLFLRQKFTFFIAKMNRDDLMTLCGLIEAGKVTAVIDRRYPLTETAGAIAYLEEGPRPGESRHHLPVVYATLLGFPSFSRRSVSLTDETSRLHSLTPCHGGFECN
jgi:Zinc-binding dehydrogenase